jgi:DNA mismatch endonuclease (patch repair protein)
MKRKKQKKPKTRSEIMASVKSYDTQPERAVRQIARILGARFRLNNRELPGSPDLAFHSQRKAIFVHGCFWHGHSCRRGNRIPIANRAYWIAKISRNRARDKRVRGQLRRLEWGCLTIWECQLKNPKQVTARLAKFLTPTS